MRQFTLTDWPVVKIVTKGKKSLVLTSDRGLDSQLRHNKLTHLTIRLLTLHETRRAVGGGHPHLAGEVKT